MQTKTDCELAFDTMPGPATAADYELRPVIEVPLQCIGDRLDDCPQEHWPPCDQAPAEVQTDGNSEQTPLLVRLGPHGWAVVPHQRLHLQACRRSGVTRVPIRCVLSEPREIWHLESLHGGARPALPFVNIRLTGYEGRRFARLPAVAGRVGKTAHPGFSGLPKAIANHLFGWDFVRVAAPCLVVDEAIGSHLSLVLSPRDSFYRLAWNGAYIHTPDNTRVAPDQVQSLPQFGLFIGGCSWFDPVSGLSFTGNERLQPMLLALKAADRIDLCTERLVVAGRAQGERQGPGGLCLMAAQRWLSPAGLAKTFSLDEYGVWYPREDEVCAYLKT